MQTGFTPGCTNSATVHGNPGQCSKDSSCRTCIASCAPGSQAPRARAPARRQRAAWPLPPPRRAPQYALGAPRLKLDQQDMAHIGQTSLTSPYPLLRAHSATPAWRVQLCQLSFEAPTPAERSLGIAALSHCRTNSMSYTSLSRSARSSASAAAKRCSAAASASARASARAWCT